MGGVGAVQRPRAPLLEAALVSQARRGRLLPCRLLSASPFSRGPGALVCPGRGLRRQERVLLITNGSFQCKISIDTIFPKGVSLEVWNF